MDILLSTLFALLLSLPSTPGRPDLPPERLLEISNHAAIGTIVRVYTKEITDPHYLTTLCLAEIAVEEVVKSDSLQIGNRVFVKYSFKKWIADGLPPPGWGGQGSEFGAGHRVKAYLKGNHATGFTLVEPNGFAPFPKEVELSKDALIVLQRQFCRLCLDHGNSRFMTKIESREMRRLLVTQDLFESIEKRLGTPRKDGHKLKKLTDDINDLDRLDAGENAGKIEEFRKRLYEIPTGG